MQFITPIKSDRFKNMNIKKVSDKKNIHVYTKVIGNKSMNRFDCDLFRDMHAYVYSFMEPTIYILLLLKTIEKFI